MIIDGSMQNLIDANAHRSASAATSQCAQARHAISILESVTPPSGRRCSTPRGKQLHDNYLHTLQLRLTHSAQTLAEIAELHHMTKHAYWSQLRRALAYADQIQKM